MASHGIWYGLAGLACYKVWPGVHRVVLWYGLGPGMGNGMALPASHGIVGPGGHRMVYSVAWRASHCKWLWPGRQSMGLGIVCSIAWRAWHGIWYDLACKEWCMVGPGAHGMIYGMAWRSWHGIHICNGLAGITWYMV